MESKIYGNPKLNLILVLFLAPMACIVSSMGVMAGELELGCNSMKMTTVANADGNIFLRHSIPIAPPLNSEFGFYFLACLDSSCSKPLNEILGVDAYMPEHKHGMNRKVLISGDASCRFADGVVLYMPGQWNVFIDVKVKGRVYRITQIVTVE